MCSLTFTLHLTVPNQRWGGVDCPEKTKKQKQKQKQTNKQTKTKKKEQLLMIALLNCF